MCFSAGDFGGDVIGEAGDCVGEGEGDFFGGGVAGEVYQVDFVGGGEEGEGEGVF